MKLVDILARELAEWPEDLEYAHQDYDGEIRFYGGLRKTVDFDFYAEELSDDRCIKGQSQTGSRITRAEWQAAVEALKAEQASELKWPDGATHFQDGDSLKSAPCFWRVFEGKATKVWRMKKDLVTVMETFSYSLDGCPSFDINKCIPRPTERAVEWDGAGLPPVGTVCQFKSVGHHDDPEYKWCIYRGKMSCGGYIVEYHHHTSPSMVTCAPFDPALTTFRPIRTQEQIDAEEREKAVAEMAEVIHGQPVAGLKDSALYALYAAGYRKQVSE